MATPLKILFADDDLKYSLLLKRFLEKEGYDVAYTGNGMMVLEQFPVVKPDLVLLDINMPGLNGFEVAEKIRENDRHVLIFFLSDRSDKNDRLKGFSLKGNDYLAKPFYPEELLARIKERFEVNPDVKVEEEIYHFANTVFDYSTNEIRTGNSKTLVTLYERAECLFLCRKVADHLASFLLRDQKDDRDDSPRYYCQRRDNGCQSPTEINESPDKRNLYRTGLQQRRFLRQVFPSLRGDVTAGVSQQLSQPSYLNLFRLK